MTVEVAKFPWGASGRALTFDRPDGLTKLIIDPETERILGVVRKSFNFTLKCMSFLFHLYLTHTFVLVAQQHYLLQLHSDAFAR